MTGRKRAKHRTAGPPRGGTILNPKLPIAAVLSLVLVGLVPGAAAEAPPAPDFPTVHECSYFQVDWNRCEALLCAFVRWDDAGVRERACVGEGVLCWPPHCLLEATPQSGDEMPDVSTCAVVIDPCWEADDAACASATWRNVRTVPVCAGTQPCDGLRLCVASAPPTPGCPTLRDCLGCMFYPGCGFPVGECSEFQVDWYHCPGEVVCVWSDNPVQDVRRECVSDPCPPRFTQCVVAECASEVCYHECDLTVSPSYGWVDCDGRRVTDWYCVSLCFGYPDPVTCHVDTNGRVDCVTRVDRLP